MKIQPIRKRRKRANINIEKARILTEGFFPGGFKSSFSSSRGVVVTGAKKFAYGKDPLNSIIPSSMFKTVPDATTREKLRNLTIVIVGDISDSMFDSSTDIKKIDIVMLLLGAGFNWAKKGNKVGALLFDEEIRTFDISEGITAGEDAILRLERDMEDFETHTKKSTHRITNAQPALAELVDSLPDPSLIFLVTDGIFLLNCEDELGELAGFHKIVPVIIDDKSDEIDLPWWAYFVARDIESGQMVSASQLEKDETVVDYFEENDTLVIRVDTGTDYRGTLFKIRKFFTDTGGF